MNANELLSSLRHLVPAFTIIEGCTLLARDEPSLEGVRRVIRRNQRAGVALDGQVDVDRSLTWTERDMNRTFIADLLEEIIEGPSDFTHTDRHDDLLFVADVVAALLRDGLQQTFPGVSFLVEVVGRDLVDNEPLELCVTFSRVR